MRNKISSLFRVAGQSPACLFICIRDVYIHLGKPAQVVAVGMPELAVITQEDTFLALFEHRPADLRFIGGSVGDPAALAQPAAGEEEQVSVDNAVRMRAAGADMFVCGTSSIFSKSGTLEENTARFRACISGE